MFIPEQPNPNVQKYSGGVWIDGAGFVSGRSAFYTGDSLSAFDRVIVMTLNYRLAQIGFLRTDDGTGNFGLWDQHLAIK